MDNTQTIEIIRVEGQQQLLNLKKDVQGLFIRVFGKQLSDEAWEHYYLNSPYGTSAVFVAYSGKDIIAHGGLIPQKLLSREGEEYDYYLQTAIMIEKEHRGLHLFKKLMDEIHQFVMEREVFDLAFPNDQSFLPFVKLFEWQNVREYSIYQYVLADDCASSGQYEKDTEHDFTYYLKLNDEFLKWRGELNYLKVFEEEGCKVVYKNYEGALEFLDVSVRKRGIKISVCEITGSLGYSKVNIPECFFDMLDLKGLSLVGTVGIPQRMCLFPSSIDSVEYKGIKPSLLLSDVF
jgi:hypothetical protein